MRESSQLPRYRHHKARNLAVVRLGGRDHYLGPWKSLASYVEYDRLIAEYLANGRRPLDDQEGQDDAPTVAELMVAYRQYAQQYYRKDGRPTSEAAGIDDALRYLPASMDRWWRKLSRLNA